MKKRLLTSFLMLTLLLALLPLALRLTGVWLAVPLAQMMTFVVAVCAKRHVDKTQTAS